MESDEKKPEDAQMEDDAADLSKQQPANVQN